MARIRTIKPEFWADEKLGPCDPLARLVFLGLVSLADDAGRLVDSVKMLDGLLFPYTDDSTRVPLDRLHELGVIRRGATAGGQRVIQVVNWHHQKIDKPNLSSALDEICTDSPTHRRKIVEASAPHISTSISIGDQDLEPTSSDRFGEVWNVCKRGSKRQAVHQYRRVVPAKVSHEALLAAWKAHVSSASSPEYVAHLFRWIRDERWEEQVPEVPRVKAAREVEEWQGRKRATEEAIARDLAKRTASPPNANEPSGPLAGLVAKVVSGAA